MSEQNNNINNHIKEAKGDKVFGAFVIVLMIIVIICVLYPLYFVIIASVSDPNAVNSGSVVLLPKNITFEGYKRVFQNSEIYSGYINTIYYTLTGTFVALAVNFPCAFALSRPKYTGKKIVTVLFVITMFISGGLIPTYLLIKQLNLLNTVWALVLPGAASIGNIIIIRTYFQINIPNEMLEAAEIDGCGIFGQFWKIVLPLSAPILIVIGLNVAVEHWNSYFSALIYMRDRARYPLQLIIREILIQQENMSSLSAASGDAESVAEMSRIAELVKYSVIFVSAAPLLIVYPFCQKYFMKGMLIGSLKG